MPALSLASGDVERAYGRLPRLQLRNLFPENDPTNTVTGVTYLQRPGLTRVAVVGAGPIDLVWQEAGTFGGDHLVSSGGSLWRIGSSGVAISLGSIASGRAQVAGSATQAIIVAGQTAYSTDGIGMTMIAMPGGVGVSSVTYIDGFFILVVANSQRFYWIAPNETVPDPLSFAEAERSADNLVAAAVASDSIWFIGTNSEEVWVPTGDIDAPFQRVNGRVYEDGCVARDSIVEVDNSLIWVTAFNEVVLAQGSPQVISTASMAEHLRLADPASFRAWVYKLDGHTVYVLTTNRDTFAIDLSTKTPSRYSTLGRETWRAHLGAGTLCGDSDAGTLWRIDPAQPTDDGAPIDRRLSGGVENPGAPVRCNSVSLRAAVGWSPQPGFEPTLEMRWSDDGAATWTNWQSLGLGEQGEYRKSVAWRKLGLIRSPGRVFEWRMTDDAVLRISYARINEAFA